MEGTIWALLPPVLAIIISLITKEVYLSLFIGIIVGAGVFCNFNPFTTLQTTLTVMADRTYGNICVIVFIVVLGMIVHLMNKSGATKEYAKWASRKLKTKKQTLLATMFLGIIIFVDDYFNCLTVGTVMRPITDQKGISREKLAYIIDSTAAPVCIIAPVSSWAAAVSSYLPEDCGLDGFQLFMKTIFCNYYSLFTLGMVFLVIVLSVDFGNMKAFEVNQKNYLEDSNDENIESTNGKVIDLILPVVILIVCSIICMLYTGGLFEGVSVSDAFANCDAIVGLAMGVIFSLIFIALLYLPRKIVTFKEFLDGLVEGFKQMVPATLILVFAWTIGGICGDEYLNAGSFVATTVEKYNIVLTFMPAIFFIIALLLAFSTGTSWGTFAILLPIALAVFNNQESILMISTMAAVLGGAVCGDHISPISDTTILSSTGAGCNHINHVSSQMQYGLIVAAISVISYIICGITNNSNIGLIIGFVLLVVVLTTIKVIDSRRYKNNI